MTKAKIVLAAICLFSAVGGAMAFKARATTGQVFRAGRTYTVTVAPNCTNIGIGCSYTFPDLPNTAYQLYTYSAPLSTYNPVKP